MRRLACLLLTLSIATALRAGDAAPATPPADDACAGETAAKAEAVPADAPARVDAAPAARPAGSSGGGLRPSTPRWHRLLPGMFR
jgi:hypothetical protein